MRQRNYGIRKHCGCSRAKWPKCPHGWHFNFRWKGVNHRLSLDRECGRHIGSKTETQAEAERIRTEIRNDAFRQGGGEVKAPPSTFLSVVEYAQVFLERYSKARGKVSRKNDEQRLDKLTAFVLPRTKRPIGGMSVESVTEDDCEVFLNGLKAGGLAASTRKVRPACEGHVVLGRAKRVPIETMGLAWVRYQTRETCQTKSASIA